jgi:hypothetical protein
VKLQDEPPGSTWETAIGRLAEQAVWSHDVGLHLLSDHIIAAFEIARARAMEHGRAPDTALSEVITAIRADFDGTLARVEAAMRAEGH